MASVRTRRRVAAVVAAGTVALAGVGGYQAYRATTEAVEPTFTRVPEEYLPAVVTAGAICPQISSEVIAAQIETESEWDPEAHSQADAQGLAQFIPATWEKYGKDYDADGTSSPKDPGDAIPAQAQLMCDLVARMQLNISKGNITGEPVELALAGYNGGPENVIAAKGIPDFPETQAYVQKVMGRVPVYREALATQTGSSSH